MRNLGFDLIILGAPAGGKDTQAAILMKKYRLKPVESGKYWRKMAARKDRVGDMLRRTFSKGQPAPVKLMKDFIQEQLGKVPAGRDLIFIGNPRLKPEAQLLVKLLTAKKRDYLVLSIDLPAAVIKKRSTERRRDEQDWKYVGNRIKTYRTQVSKTLAYFKSLGKLRSINGNRSISQVAASIAREIDDYQRREAN